MLAEVAVFRAVGDKLADQWLCVLVQAGRDAEVLQLRRTFQKTMRADLIAAVG